MDARAAQQAAEMLWRLWQTGATIATLPDECRPTSLDDGWQIQRALDRFAGRRVGWKIAGSSLAGRQHIGTDAPMAGAIYEGTVFRGGASLPRRAMQVAEAEFAFVMAADLPADGGPYARAQVLAAVAEMRPAIETPDSRFVDYVAAGAAQMCAEAACAAALVLGEPVANWRPEDLPDRSVVVLCNGVEVSTGRGSNALGDPCEALCWMANELVARGEGLRAGDVVLTGTCATPVHVDHGDHVVASFGDYGTVDLWFV